MIKWWNEQGNCTSSEEKIVTEKKKKSIFYTTHRFDCAIRVRSVWSKLHAILGRERILPGWRVHDWETSSSNRDIWQCARTWNELCKNIVTSSQHGHRDAAFCQCSTSAYFWNRSFAWTISTLNIRAKILEQEKRQDGSEVNVFEKKNVNPLWLPTHRESSCFCCFAHCFEVKVESE